MTEENETTIRISKQTRQRLKQHGSKGDTYEDVINHLMDAYKKNSCER